MTLIAALNIPVKTVSEANAAEHWSKKHRRHKSQKRAIHTCFAGKARSDVINAGLPIHVKLIRIAPRKLDALENLPMSVKSIKDYIADIICPGMQMGRADEGHGITWSIEQEKGQPKEYALKVEFYK